MSDANPRLVDLPALRRGAFSIIRGAGEVASSSVALPKAFSPIVHMLVTDRLIDAEELTVELDRLFEQLYQHPISEHSRAVTKQLRRYRFIPNEESTESLIHYALKQTALRSPVDVPEVVIDEFWHFFRELIESPELKGVVELNLDIVRSVLRTYEPLLLEIINAVKHARQINQKSLAEIVQRLLVLRGDLHILQRQIRAIRYIKPFLQTDPRDFGAQARIVAQMVREFGPLFIKMAQVAAANSDFLPAEISRELEVFQEDVEPMSSAEVYQAFLEDFGEKPENRYFGFDVNKPIKSGSIGSVFVAKKPILRGGKETLVPIVIKVARHNLEREFTMGALAIELMLISSQYWAPHSKLRPFLSAMAEQIKEFTRGFEKELDFKHEAEVQNRFFERSVGSSKWSVPRLYECSGRVLEMEYLQEASAINQAIESFDATQRKRRQRRLAENFLHTMMEHLLIYQEFHGDLHPGNIMADVDAHLFLIDWGNSVEMRGKWGLIGRYFLAVVSGDAENLARILIDLSTEQEVDEARYREIKAVLRETLEKKDITPLRGDFVLQLFNEGSEGLQQRLQTAIHLMSNTYHLGLTIKSDYLHLSRSLFAMAGTYNNLYRGLSGWTMARDFALDVALFPVKYTFNQILVPASKVEKLALRPGALSRRRTVRKAPLYSNAEGAAFLDGVYYPACARKSSLPPAAGTWRV